MSLIVSATGPQCLIVDTGRPGYAALGVGGGGAFDRSALARANRLVGNADTAAGLEVLLGGLELRSSTTVTLAVAGARGPALIGHRPAPLDTSVVLPADSILRLGPASTGLRRYLAVRGGIDVPAVLGSRSTDTLTGVGPPPVMPGADLPVGRAYGPVPDVEFALPPTFPADPVRLDATAGPRLDHLTAAARVALLTTVWTVGADSDRVGVRLDGPSLERMITPDPPSEGVRAGSVELAGDRRPVIFGPDGPVTGGYPVVAVLTAAGLDTLAQLAPGRRVRLDLASPPPWADLDLP